MKKIPRITRALGEIDEELISEAQNAEIMPRKKAIIKWGSLAACFALLVTCSALILPAVLGDEGDERDENENAAVEDGSPEGEPDGQSPSGQEESRDGKYKYALMQSESGMILWQWEWLATCERYTNLTLDGVEYRGSGREISRELIGESLGAHSIVGFDYISEDKYTEQFELYSLRYADPSRFIAALMDGRYYIFKRDGYASPSTLGELFEQVDMEKAVTLGRFSKGSDGPDGEHFMLKDDSFVWNTLRECSDAEFVEDDGWRRGDREYLSFSITSETLGVYRVAMYIIEDGYLWTNAFDYAYVFNIGKDAAKSIIDYAEENSERAEYQPYRNSVYGKVVEITDGYLIIDDTDICKDPAEGESFRVPLDDIRISRYVENRVVGLGSLVQVSYEGSIDENNENTVGKAVSISTVMFVEGEVLIPE